MKRFQSPDELYTAARQNEKKPLVCVYCGKTAIFYTYKEWPDSLTNSAPFCQACAQFYDSVHEKYGEE